MRGLKITAIEVYEIERIVRDMGPREAYAVYEPGTTHVAKACILRIHTDGGITGESVSTQLEAASFPLLLPHLIGMNALEREGIYNEGKRILRYYGRMGLGIVDVALWDIAGKYYNAPIYELLGGFRKKLPVYASTAHGDYHGGLDSPEAYADFAEHCLQLGYRAFKIHSWWKAPVSTHVATIHAVGKRVGGKMDLMLDLSGEPDTLADALKIGMACDEEGFFWLEDPFGGSGNTPFAHQVLRQMIKTPLLMGEHIRTLEQRIAFLLSGATNIIRGGVHTDGITGTMKLAHAAEALGIDVELHGAGPATRHCMAAIPNTNYFEWGIVHPKVKPTSDVHGGASTLYIGYADGQLDGIDKDGCISVPEGPGLGVEHDWEHIKAHQAAFIRYQ